MMNYAIVQYKGEWIENDDNRMKYVKEQQKVVKFLRTQHSRDYINPIVEQASPY